MVGAILTSAENATKTHPTIQKPVDLAYNVTLSEYRTIQIERETTSAEVSDSKAATWTRRL